MSSAPPAPARTATSRATPWADEARAMLWLAGPLILTNITQMLISFTDVLLLGRLSADALAASALGSSIVFAMLMFGIGLVTAASPLLAAEIGRNRYAVREVRRTVRQSMWAAIAFTLPCWALLWFTAPMLRAIGQPERLATDTGAFVGAMQWMILPALGGVVLRAFLSALERPVWSLIVGGLGVIVNALVNWVLIFGALGVPALGLIGAGIGSSLTTLTMFGATAAIVTLHPRFRRYALFGRFWRPDWPRFMAVMKLGSPIAITLGLEASVFSAAVFLMGFIGTTSVAAHAIAIQIASMTFMVPLGVAQAVTVRVGLGYGRGDAAAITRAGWTGLVIGTGFMAVMAIVIWMYPRALATLFLDPDMRGNAEVLDLAVGFLTIAAIFQIVDGAQSVGAGMLRGLQDTTWPMLFALFGYWVIGIGVGAGLAFPGGMDGFGVWIGLATGLAIVSVLMVWRWLARGRLGLLPLVPSRGIPTT